MNLEDAKWIPHERSTWPWVLATLVEPVKFAKWQGHYADPEFIVGIWPVGTPVKIVMVSRFGDVGITDDLSAVRGYHARVDLSVLRPMQGASIAEDME